MWIFLAIIALVTLGYYYRKSNLFWTRNGVPQGTVAELTWDRFGTLFQRQSFADMFLAIYNRHPNTRYVGYYQFGIPTLMLKDPDLIKQITVKDFDHFTDHRGFIPEDADLLWGRNLFALTGKKWRDMRATLSPSFTSAKMKYMFTLIDDTARNFVAHFKNLDQDQVEVELKDTFSRFTNDVIATAAFGIKVDSLKDRENEFLLKGRRATDFTGFFKLVKFIAYAFIPNVLQKFNFKFFDDDVREFFINLMKDTVRMREERNIIRPDMVHLLMEARKGNQKTEDPIGDLDTGFATAQESTINRKEIRTQITDIDMAAQGMIFFFAGFDSVSNLMCFAGYELASNPEIQNRLREEIKDTLKNGPVTYEALLKMKYLDMVVSEVLRKWPSAIGMDRVCTKAYTIKASGPNEVDVHLPEKSVIWLPIFPLHRDPKYYPDPEKFDPERFSDENKSKINPYAYIPFGSGPRNCIGSRFALLETKVVICHILDQFELVPCQRSVIPMKYDRKQFNIMPQDKFWFGLKRLS